MTQRRRSNGRFLAPLCLLAALGGLFFARPPAEEVAAGPPIQPPGRAGFWLPDVAPSGFAPPGVNAPAPGASFGYGGYRPPQLPAPSGAVPGSRLQAPGQGRPHLEPGAWSLEPRPSGRELRANRAQRALPFRYRRIAGLGDPAPGGGTHGGNFEISDVNDGGLATIGSDLEWIWLPSDRRGPARPPAYSPYPEMVRGEALYLLRPDGSGTRVASPGDPVAEGARHGTVIYMPPVLNAVGQVAWAGQVEGGETWLFLHDARTGRTRVIARPGTAAPDGSLFLPAGRQRIVLNDYGDLAFDAQMGGGAATPAPGVVAMIRGERRMVARPGMPAPEGETFLAAESPAINAAGEVVFHASVAAGHGLSVYVWREGFLTPVAGRGSVVARREDGTRPAARRLWEAFHPQIDARGAVVFVGRTERGDGLYRWIGGETRALLEPGDPLPGVGALATLHFHRRRPFHLNGRGDVAFSADGAEGNGVFIITARGTRAVALAGVPLPGVGTPEEVGSPDGGAAYPYGGYGTPYGPPGSPFNPYGAPPGTAGPRRTPPPSGGGGPSRAAPGGSRPALRAGETRPQRRERDRPASTARPGAAYPGAALYGASWGGGYGIALSDSGAVLFPARVDGRICVVRALPVESGAGRRAR